MLDIAFHDLPAADQAHIRQHHRPGLQWVYEPLGDDAPWQIQVVPIANLGLWAQWMTREPELAARMRQVAEIPDLTHDGCQRLRESP